MARASGLPGPLSFPSPIVDHHRVAVAEEKAASNMPPQPCRSRRSGIMRLRGSRGDPTGYADCRGPGAIPARSVSRRPSVCPHESFPRSTACLAPSTAHANIRWAGASSPAAD